MPAARLYNLARMTTPTTGTGTLALGAAVPSFLSFAQAGVQDGDTVTYAIEDGVNREIGRGVYGAAGATLTRAVLKSTNGDAPINLSGGAQVFITAAAQDFPIAAAGTANFLPKWDGNAALTGTSKIYDDGTHVGINNSAPDANLDVSANSGPLPSAGLAGVRVAGPNASAFTGFQLDSFGSFVVCRLRRANNTAQAPQALNSGDQIGNFGYGGYGATAYSASNIAIHGFATENWSDVAQGCALAIATVANGTLTRTERLRVDQDGTLLHRAQATIVIDANSHLGLRTYTVVTLPSPSIAARLIYVSDGTSNKRLAVSDGTNWRFPDGNIVS